MIILAVILHFIFDWVVQDRTIAKTKKITPSALLYHIVHDVASYLLILSIVAHYMLDVSWLNCFYFFSFNLVCHFLTDMFLPSGNNEREMINWTAVDQIIHLVTLITSIYVIGG